MFCMSCGAPLPDDAAFCPVCGAKVTGKPQRADSYLYSLKCTSCGSSNLRKTGAGEYQCEHCGTKIFIDRQNSGADEMSSEEEDAQVAVYVSEAAAFAEKKDYQNEIRMLAKAMELAPDDNLVLLRLGRAYWRHGSMDKAMEYYRIAEKLYPDDPSVYVNIGSVFFKLGHYEEAKEQYEKAIAMIVSDPMSSCAEDTAVAYGNYAYCLGKLGDRKNAKKYLSIAKEKGYSKDSIDTICRDLHLGWFFL